jgi:hypothetical protein
MGELIPESQMECTRLRGCLKHPGARAYLNKDVIAELESWINGLEYPDCPPGDAYAQVIALLKDTALKDRISTVRVERITLDGSSGYTLRCSGARGGGSDDQ